VLAARNAISSSESNATGKPFDVASAGSPQLRAKCYQLKASNLKSLGNLLLPLPFWFRFCFLVCHSRRESAFAFAFAFLGCHSRRESAFAFAFAFAFALLGCHSRRESAFNSALAFTLAVAAASLFIPERNLLLPSLCHPAGSPVLAR
jgi:hypothetical protein